MQNHSTLIGLGLLILLLAGDAKAQFSDRFGAAVGVVEGSAVVLKPSLGLGRAGAYLFRWTGTGWALSDAVHPIDHDRTGEGFSPSLALGANSVVVAAADAHAVWAAHWFSVAEGSWQASRVPLVADAAERGPEPMTLATLNAVAGPPERTLALSADGRRLAVSVDGSESVTVLERTPSGSWGIAGSITAPGDGGASPTDFGVALAFDSEGTLWVGAPRHGASGAAFGYGPGPLGASAPDTLQMSSLEPGSWFGAALLATPRGLVVGAPGASTVIGWTDGTPLALRAAGNVSNFGAALATDGTELWVGAPGTDAGRGSVHRFAWVDGRRGEPLGELRPAALEAGDSFGRSIAVAEGVAVVGAPFAAAGRGRAAAFRRNGESWGAAEWLDPGIALSEVLGAEVRCADGSAAGFDCERVDLLSFLPLAGLGAGPSESISDLWGWTDPQTGREYALVGRSTGAAIVDITDPATPVYMGRVAGNRTHARDIKVYRDHMFFTGDGAGEHGLLVFDLTRLRGLRTVPVEWQPDARYDGIASAHNLVINTESGFGYTVGNRAGGTTCGGGLHMVDLRDPLNPVFAGCYTDTEGLIWQGRTHDAQCVIYRGPDADYVGREICFALNETAVRIVDVTDKSNPVPIAAGRYPGVAYIHQGWLTEDHRYFYQNDEADELAGLTDGTRTLVWNVEDLDDPVVVADHRGANNATDHNLYVVGDRMYQANYFAGLRVFDISDRENPVEVGHFDTTPYGGDPPGFSGGAWTAYPFFESGTVIVSSMNEGLFVLRPRRPIVP